MRCFLTAAACLISTTFAQAQERPPIHIWLEPEWFDGVRGSFAYWTGDAKPAGAWGVAGPGISAEWSQGGESEWNSMGAAAAETTAKCGRDLFIPRAGQYRVWVRYVDHRHKTEPFRVAIEQGGNKVLDGELGVRPVLPANDEYQLFWGFSFGWGALEAKLADGPARLTLSIDRAGEGWRQVDAILITDDAGFTPVGREKPSFAYHKSFALEAKEGAGWRGNMGQHKLGANGKRQMLGGRDFSMWAGIDSDAKWWGAQKLDQLTRYDAFFQFAPPQDIRDKFHKQYAGKKDVEIMSWPGLVPGFYLGSSPDLSPGTPLRQWLERTRTPFYILTNYAAGNYTDQTGPATYAALTGPLKEQFLGYIHGEAIGTTAVSMPGKPLAAERRGHVDGLIKHLRAAQAEAWSKIYKTKVGPEHGAKSVSCLSVDSIALAHLFHEMGAKTVGYEIDATNVHAPMRIAFERGAARQYGGHWINYASGNFGDACNYFTQEPIVPRGAKSWFHSRYAITDGVTASWYRKLYYLNYLGGAAAIFWEQGLGNQWMLPGPGNHPIQLSPFGRATVDFQEFVNRLPDRGEPYTPIGILLSSGHGYERVSYHCKMLDHFREDRNDLELRELFNVCWHPTSILEGKPASPDVQSMPSGTYGDIFDVIVDRPARLQAMFDYPVVWAAGDVQLGGAAQKTVEQYLQGGGTLVVNINQAKQLPAAWLGLKDAGKRVRAEQWSPDGATKHAAAPFEVAQVELAGATPLAWADKETPLATRQQVGAGAVIVTLVPHLLGLDERAHPALPYLMNGLTRELLPVEVRLPDGRRPAGEVMYSLNQTKDGWLVALYNQRGLDKTQNGIARVDRRAAVDVVLRSRQPIRAAKEWTEPSELPVTKAHGDAEVAVRVPPGDVRVVELKVK